MQTLDFSPAVGSVRPKGTQFSVLIEAHYYARYMIRSLDSSDVFVFFP